MKRFHVHVAVKDLQDSIRFYSAMFGAEPAVVKPDYAKWMLDDPRINFAISQRSPTIGVKHLGFQRKPKPSSKASTRICSGPTARSWPKRACTAAMRSRTNIG